MSLWELFLLALGLSADAFAVALCQGITMKKFDWKHALIVGLFFGGFQALMPFLGWALGKQFEAYITKFDHWIAFVLLAFIGGKMIIEAVKSSIESKAGKATAADRANATPRAENASATAGSAGFSSETGSAGFSPETMGDADISTRTAAAPTAETAAAPTAETTAAPTAEDTAAPAPKKANLKELTILAVATSIDALAVGISFAFLQVRIVPSVSLIGATTLALSVLGVFIGFRFGTRFKEKAELAGGIVLCLIGLKILLEHLGVLPF